MSNYDEFIGNIKNFNLTIIVKIEYCKKYIYQTPISVGSKFDKVLLRLYKMEIIIHVWVNGPAIGSTIIIS